MNSYRPLDPETATRIYAEMRRVDPIDSPPDAIPDDDDQLSAAKGFAAAICAGVLIWIVIAVVWEAFK